LAESAPPIFCKSSNIQKSLIWIFPSAHQLANKKGTTKTPEKAKKRPKLVEKSRKRPKNFHEGQTGPNPALNQQQQQY
jgi:hypothetical protein